MTGKCGCVLAVMATLGAWTGAQAQETQEMAPVTTTSHEQERAEPGHLRGLELGLRAGFQ